MFRTIYQCEVCQATYRVEKNASRHILRDHQGNGGLGMADYFTTIPNGTNRVRLKPLGWDTAKNHHER